jgi:hypothetical protein
MDSRHNRKRTTLNGGISLIPSMKFSPRKDWKRTPLSLLKESELKLSMEDKAPQRLRSTLSMELSRDSRLRLLERDLMPRVSSKIGIDTNISRSPQNNSDKSSQLSTSHSVTEKSTLSSRDSETKLMR